MSEEFIKRDLYTKFNNEIHETRISITIPKISDDGLYECYVIFSNVEKYDSASKGIDEFNAIECALEYVESICRNSDSPEFFITRFESMRRANYTR